MRYLSWHYKRHYECLRSSHWDQLNNPNLLAVATCINKVKSALLRVQRNYLTAVVAAASEGNNSLYQSVSTSPEHSRWQVTFKNFANVVAFFGIWSVNWEPFASFVELLIGDHISRVLFHSSQQALANHARMR